MNPDFCMLKNGMDFLIWSQVEPGGGIIATVIPNRQLFYAGERSRQAVTSSARGYRCPVCWREFTKDRISELTVEHVPQKSWGSLVALLTCKDCNNRFGYKYQPALANLNNLQEIRMGTYRKRPVPATVEYGEKKFNARVKNDEQGRWVIQGSAKNNPPEVARYWLDNPELKRQPVHITLKGVLDKGAIERVLLRDSYLLAFHYLGYPYVCLPVVQDLRRILAEDLEIPDGAMLDLPEPPLATNAGQGEFLWVQEPECLASLLAPFQVPGIGRRHVLLPFFSFPSKRLCWTTYHDLCDRWMQLHDSQGKTELDISKAVLDLSARYSPLLHFAPLPDGSVKVSGSPFSTPHHSTS